MSLLKPDNGQMNLLNAIAAYISLNLDVCLGPVEGSLLNFTSDDSWAIQTTWGNKGRIVFLPLVVNIELDKSILTNGASALCLHCDLMVVFRPP